MESTFPHCFGVWVRVCVCYLLTSFFQNAYHFYCCREFTCEDGYLVVGIIYSTSSVLWDILNCFQFILFLYLYVILFHVADLSISCVIFVSYISFHWWFESSPLIVLQQSLSFHWEYLNQSLSALGFNQFLQISPPLLSCESRYFCIYYLLQSLILS